DEPLEQGDLVLGARPERAQVPGVDPVLPELGTRRGDLDVGVGVALLSRLGARREQTELLELACELRRDARARTELVEGQVLVPLLEIGGAAAALRLGARRRELLADHAERQELVALEAEDRLEALDVLLVEEPVAALRPAGGEQPLVLEVADLRDRDVGELL